MAADVVIHAQGLSKKYVIGHQAERERYVALRDVIGRTARDFARTTSDFLRGRTMVSGDTTEEFWALKDVSFEVRRGEVLGIIGRNGAGKSTLLKILSRITEPSEGRIHIRGRVASLLEVGTGFHPELTGRENIYLNGAILGMTRAEIRRKFDEIVAFAEVEKFIDTPVKRYSSGMYVRLAFAVAAHLEPDILAVDEVLSVGDADFQRKCCDKIGDVVTGGRTVIIVSHQLQSVLKFCKRAIVLQSGRITFNASAAAAVSSYLSSQNVSASHVLFYKVSENRTDADITALETLDEMCRPKVKISTFDYVRFRLRIKCHRVVPHASAIIEVKSADGFTVLKIESHPSTLPLLTDRGDFSIDCCVRQFPIMEGNYLLSVGLAVYGVTTIAWHSDVATLLVVSPPTFYQSVDNRGVMAVTHEWKAFPESLCDKTDTSPSGPRGQ
jgi:lipopolysaccharide transport system ATP-binding protein